MAAAGLVGRDDKKGEERRGGGLGANCRFSHYRAAFVDSMCSEFLLRSFLPSSDFAAANYTEGLGLVSITLATKQLQYE